MVVPRKAVDDDMVRRWAAALTVLAVMAMQAGAWAASSSSTPSLPLELSGAISVSGSGTVPDGLPIHAFIGGQQVDIASAQTSGGSFSNLEVSPPTNTTAAITFTVGGLAATGVYTGAPIPGTVTANTPNPCTATANAPVTFIPGGEFCMVVLTVATAPSSTPVSGTVAATSTGGSVTVGGSGTAVADTTATASGGAGTVAVAQYQTTPAGAPTPTFTADPNAYVDINVTPGSRFTALTVQQCGLATGDLLYWLDGSTWQQVTPQSPVDSSGCITATLSGSSSPTIAQLTGTVFAASQTAAASGSSSTTVVTSSGGGGGGSIPPYVTGVSPTSGPAGTQITLTGTNFTGATIVFFNGTPGTGLVVDSDTELTVDVPSGLTGVVDVTVQNAHGTSAVVPAAVFTYSAGSAQVSSSVTTAGGTLSTADGTFTMAVPAGDITGTGTLSLTESSSAPTGLPTGFTVASPVFTLAGATLTTPARAVIQYQGAVLNGLQPQRLAVYTQSAAGGWTFVPTVVGTGGSVSANVSGPETLVVLLNPSTFSDIPTGYWARGDIDTLLAAGVVSGFPGGTFQPNGALTRAQFVKMLDLVLGLQPGTGTGGFTDVSASDWFAPYVTAAVHAGLVQGLTSTTFGPNDTVSREQMAVLLARALKLTGGAQLTFSDAGQIDSYATAAVQAAVGAGYLSGFPNGTFQPQGATTRAQAAKVLAMALAAEAAGH